MPPVRGIITYHTISSFSLTILLLTRDRVSGVVDLRWKQVVSFGVIGDFEILICTAKFVLSRCIILAYCDCVLSLYFRFSPFSTRRDSEHVFAVARSKGPAEAPGSTTTTRAPTATRTLSGSPNDVEPPDWGTNGARYPTDGPRYSPNGARYSTNGRKPAHGSGNTKRARYATNGPWNSPNGSRYPAKRTRNTTDGARYTPNGTRYPTDGARHSANGTRYPPNGSRYSANGSGYPANGLECTANGVAENGAGADANVARSASNAEHISRDVDAESWTNDGPTSGHDCAKVGTARHDGREDDVVTETNESL